MVDLSAIAKWPNVPACYEWLSLDRRGNWRLQGERVTHRGLIEFMNRQYGSEPSGRWFVQNGPQRVYVDLAATPWVFRLQDQTLISHTGQTANEVIGLHADTEGSIYIETDLGAGLLDDRDLSAFLDQCITSHGRVGDDEIAALLAGADPAITWNKLPLKPLGTVNPEIRFNFVQRPRP